MSNGVWSEIVGRPSTDDPLVRQPSRKEVRVRLTVELQTTEQRKPKGPASRSILSE